MKTVVATLLVCAGICLRAKEFENLNFEAGNPANVHPQPGKSFLLGPTAELLPGWRVQYDGVEVEEIHFDPQGQPGYCCGVALSEVLPAWQAEYGKYALSVDPVRFGPGPGPNGEILGIPITISQTGRVPENAQSLRFSRPFFVPEIRINGQIAAWDRATSTLSVSGYAGQEIDLAITFKPNQNDNFEIFGFASVPEPETWALLAVGGVALGWHCWRQKRL